MAYEVFGGLPGTRQEGLERRQQLQEESTMALVRWDPARELASMEVDRLNRMFSDLWGGEGLGRGWVPAVDIYEAHDRELVLKAELPDMKREDIHVTFENNVLTIQGERKLAEEVKRENVQRMERYYGAFTRSFTLPATVDGTRITAAYKDGVLTIRLPQREEARPKQITVGE
jgi:HSP20 family protein